MLHSTTRQRQVFTFKHYANTKYALFNCLHKEVRIGCLTMAMLATLPSAALTCSTDSVRLHREAVPEDRMLDDAVVTGSRVPLTLAETADKVEIITRDEIQRAKVQTVNDILKLCQSVDVRQRGGYGVQTDISIGGGTFDQISILLNGVSLNNPQTGHLSADFPVAMDDIERIEVYDGVGAIAFGSQALNGAVNIITRAESGDEAGVHAEGGSYGTLGGGAYLNVASSRCRHRISGDVIRSDGGTSNSNFEKYRTFYQGNYTASDLKLSWQGGWNKQRYGANTFYSAKFPDQWEQGDRYMGSLKAITDGRIHLAPTLSWVRSYDHFQLIRHQAKGENFHRNDVFTVGLNIYTDWKLGRTAFGGELRQEGILSTNIGRPLTPDRYVAVEGKTNTFYNYRDNRTNISFFMEHDVIVGKFSLSAHAMANRNTGINDRFTLYPGVSLSFRPTSGLKLFASWNESLRLPTFTDLYYKSPTQEGNIGLRPEKASTFKLGAAWRKGAVTASADALYRHGTDMIDWVMYTPHDKYHSTNFKIDNYELQAEAAVDFTRLWGKDSWMERITAGYTYNYQQRHDHKQIFKSNYALDYLRHKLLAGLSHRVWNRLDATWYLRWQDRMGSWLGYDAQGKPELNAYRQYVLLSLKLQWTEQKYNMYASLENLTCHRYYDIGAVPQPRFWMTVGGSLKFRL